MAFLKALLKMKRERQRETFQSRLTMRSHAPLTVPVPPSTNSTSFLDDRNDKCLGSSSRAKHHTAINVPVAKPQIVNSFPKQFILARPETPSSSDYDSDDEEFKLSDVDVYNPSQGKFPTSGQPTPKQRQQVDRFDKEYFNFSDLDYEMPQEVREILHEEGLDPSTVESWLHKAEVCHRRAFSMRRFESAKLIKATKKNVSLPPIKSTDASPQPVFELPDKPATVHWSVSPAPDKYGSLPDICPVQYGEGEEQEEERGPKACEEMKRVLSEAEEVKWRCEQQLERMTMPGLDQVPPRLVLISSRVAWCHSLSKAARCDDHKERTLAMVYDFENWTFQDLLEAAHRLLDSEHTGCKARSVMLLCKGGPGYFYLLRNFVMTPQKMSRPRYKAAREFWHSMGKLISKLEPADAKIHLIGPDLQTNNQGQKLAQSLWKAVHPSKVEIVSPIENTPSGKACIELYFDYPKYLLWRSRPDSGCSLRVANQFTRSWSSIEDEVQRKEALPGTIHA